jgi:hypothetical protein
MLPPRALLAHQLAPRAKWERLDITFQIVIMKKKCRPGPIVTSGVTGMPGSHETAKGSETLVVSRHLALTVSRRAIQVACRWASDMPWERSHALSNQRGCS